MLSYSVNTTFRDDEFFWDNRPTARPPLIRNNNNLGNFGSNQGNSNWNPNGRPPYGSNVNWGGGYGRPPSQGRDCESTVAKSRAPWEMGVVWSPTGPVAAGTMMAGLAAGLFPDSVTWSGGVVENGWAASLAGDLAQTALMKRKNEPYVGPDGFFNSTICPMEFYLQFERGFDSTTFSHLTVAEINGGLDGLLLSENSNAWERKSEFTLSQVIDLYYSTQGIHVQGSSPILSACDRYANYHKMISDNKLRDQAFAFGSELKKILVRNKWLFQTRASILFPFFQVLPFDDNSLQTSIGSAKLKLDERISVLDKVGTCAISIKFRR